VRTRYGLFPTLTVALMFSQPTSAVAAPTSPKTTHDTAASAWIASPTVQATLTQGKVAVRSVVDDRHSRATVEAAVRIHASARAIWPLIVKCRFAAWLIPGLRRCRTLESGSDGSWADIEHDIKYSRLAPMIRSVFRADFHPPYRMDFHRIRGSLKYEVGSWILSPSSDGTTTVEYEVTVQPGFWIPRFIVSRSLRRRLPEALEALRYHAERAVAAYDAPAPPTG
jgi:Polyketide cyclase / dehydrase and lipid transport